jgi:hypothetical protein
MVMLFERTHLADRGVAAPGQVEPKRRDRVREAREPREDHRLHHRVRAVPSVG